MSDHVHSRSVTPHGFSGRDHLADELMEQRDLYAHIMRELPAVIGRWRVG
jgi:hypothetical protein